MGIENLDGSTGMALSDGLRCRTAARKREESATIGRNDRLEDSGLIIHRDSTRAQMREEFSGKEVRIVHAVGSPGAAAHVHESESASPHHGA
jgi:hypothetical protein